MKMPDNKVPNRKKWQTLRDKSGGKKGLAKVSIGKKLDMFHDAVMKTERSGDISIVTKAMAELKKNLTMYAVQVSKKKEYNELSSTVKREMLSPLDKYRKSMESMSKAGMKEIAVAEREFRMVIDGTLKVTGKATKELVGMNKELSGMAKRFVKGVAAEDKADLVHFIKDAAKVVTTSKKGAKSLGDSLWKVIKDHTKDHRPVIDKFNSNLGKAKKAVNEMDAQAKRAEGHIQLLVGYIKKK
jgi:hypothetical protein